MPFQVDHASSQPIYSQLAAWIETRINSGEWQAEYKFPGEVEFAQSLGVSRGSLRKAISVLIGKSLIIQIHGKGTFVGQPAPDQTYSGRLSIYQDLMLLGIPFTTEVLEQRIMPAPEKEARRLNLSPAEAVLYLKRLRRVKGEPVVVQESFLPANRFGKLVKMDFSKMGMVDTLERQFGLSLEWASSSISVARVTASLAGLLKLKTGDPVLFHESVLFDDTGIQVETGLSWFRPDRFKFKTAIRRGENEPFYTRFVSHGDARIPRKDRLNEYTLREPSSSTSASLAQFLPIERILVNYAANDWREAVLKAGELLFSSGAVQERYGQAMVNTAIHLGPYFVVAPGIAIAHALPTEGVIRPALALLTLQPPLPFGNTENDPVRLLIAIAAIDATQHVEALKEIAGVLSDPDRQKLLMEAASPQEAFRILTGK